MIARVLVPSSDASERGALARVERLERRVGVSDSVDGPQSTPSSTAGPAVRSDAPTRSVDARPAAPAAPAADPGAQVAPAAAASVAPVAPVSTAAPVGPVPPVGPVTTQQVKDAWPQILDAVQTAKRSAWMVVFTAQVRSLNDDVLSLSFPSDNDVASFRQQGAGQGVSEYLRQAIVDILGIRVKFIARADGAPAPAATAAAVPTPATPADAPAPKPAAAKPVAVEPVAEKPAAPQAATPQAATPQAATQKAAPQKSAPQKAPTVQKPPVQASAAMTTSWATVAIPGSASAAETETTPVAASAAPDDVPFDDVPPPEIEPPFEPAVPVEPAEPAVSQSEAHVNRPSTVSSGRPTPAFQEPQRYGESVVREILGASFIEEQSVQPGGTR
jgi:DNA polymerase-3 subunit gamma/tau